MYIEFPKGDDDFKAGARLNLLIIHPDGASEFQGKLNFVQQDTCEVALYKERQRDARGSERRTLNIDAAVTAFIVNARQVMLPTPTQVVIKNISTAGVLLETLTERLPAGVVLQIEFSIKGENSIIYGKVVREQRHEDLSYSFGCQLIFLE